jgi:hypothetical protein
MIRLSLAIPMYNALDIAWLSLESISRQVDVDFEWELLVIEEEQNSFGIENIKLYEKRLKNVGCERIEYRSLKEWIPLSLKWLEIGKMASETSKVFMFAGADNYNNPDRMYHQFHVLMDSDANWVKTTKIPFYVIKTDEVFMVEYSDSKKAQCGITFSTHTDYIKQIPESNVRRSVDGWLFKNIRGRKFDNFKIVESKENWEMGFGTHGYNNLSRNRYKRLKENCRLSNEYKSLWPDDVLERIGTLREGAIL